MKVIRLDHYGRGIIKNEGKICFVEKVLPDEDIDVIVTNDKKKYQEGEALSIKNFNENRIEPNCPYYNECGGCSLLHMRNIYQNKFKEEKIKNIIEKFIDEEVIINKLVISNLFNYRNKVVLHIENDKLGYYKNKTNSLVSIDYCPLLKEKINDIIKLLKDFIKDEKNLTKATIKLGNKTNEVMLLLEGKANDYSPLLNKVDVLYINNQKLSKKDFIYSYIEDKKYIVSKDSFFQVNEEITIKLYNQILNTIKKLNSKSVLDLYCGTGTIGIFIADYVDKVLGVETVDDAIEDANKNKVLNNVKNIDFIKGKVEDNLEKITKDIDTIIVDPPRNGLNKNIISVIKEKQIKNIIYVSCDPITLARDLKMLNNLYKIEEITPYDMFPNTYHVECVCVLNLRKPL